MRFLISIVLLVTTLIVKGQVTYTPTTVQHCLGAYTPVTFNTSLGYDSLQWVSPKGIVLGNSTTLLIGPDEAPNAGQLVSISLKLFSAGKPMPGIPPLYVIPTAPFQFSLNNDTTVCRGDSVIVNVNDPSNQISKITWHSNRSDFIPPMYSPLTGLPKTYTSKKEGRYWVTVENITQTCRLTDTVTIRSINQTVELGSDQQACEGEPVYLSNINKDTILPNTTYTWDYNGYQKTSKGIYPTESGNYKLTITSPAPLYCTNSDDVNITINPVPKVDLPTNQTVCAGEKVTITNQVTNTLSNYTSFWRAKESNTIDNTTETHTTNIADVYFLTLKTPYCEATDSTIIKNFEFTVDLGDGIGERCSNESFELKNLQASTEPAQTFYLWRTPYGNFTSKTIQAKRRGQYILSVTSDFPQCTIVDTIFMGINPIPVFDLGDGKTTDESFFTFDGSFENKFPEDQFSFLWENMKMDTVYSEKKNLYLDKKGEHQVHLQIKDKQTGCSFDDSFIIIIPEEPIISSHVMYIPDAISPRASNPDNAKLKVLGPDIDIEGFQFTLFNRWGEVIFETSDFDFMKREGWDASNSSSEQQNGTYTYITKGQFRDGEPFSTTGTVTVLR